ncbi:hypothetical protein JCM21900_000966 [Sporobolomyces salmonicolor]
MYKPSTWSGQLTFFKTKAGSTELLDQVVLLDFVALINTCSGDGDCLFDNTSNVGRRMDKLGEYGLDKDKWVQCWAHILNLTIFVYFDSTTELQFADLRPESKGKVPSDEDQQQSLTTCDIWFSDDDVVLAALQRKEVKRWIVRV